MRVSEKVAVYRAGRGASLGTNPAGTLSLGFQTCPEHKHLLFKPPVCGFLLWHSKLTRYREKPVFTQPFKSHRTFSVYLFNFKLLVEGIGKHYQSSV